MTLANWHVTLTQWHVSSTLDPSTRDKWPWPTDTWPMTRTNWHVAVILTHWHVTSDLDQLTLDQWSCFAHRACSAARRQPVVHTRARGRHVLLSGVQIVVTWPAISAVICVVARVHQMTRVPDITYRKEKKKITCIDNRWSLIFFFISFLTKFICLFSSDFVGGKSEIQRIFFLKYES